MFYINKIKNRLIFVPIITAVASALFLAFSGYTVKTSTYKTYIEFLNDVSKKQVTTVYMTNTPEIKYTDKNQKMYETDNPRIDNFKEVLLKQGIRVSEKAPSEMMQLIPVFALIASVIAIAAISLKSSGIQAKKILSVDSIDLSSSEKSNYDFNSMAGNEEAKESAKDIVDFLKNPQKYSSYGAHMPRGIILYGEPGTGKTLLAKAVAGEAEVPFYAMSGSDFIQIYVGVGASRIRQLFKKAKSNGKAVIFIDEIDAIGKKRDGGKSTGGSDERDQTLNALLTEMSGFNEKDGVIVLAATNRLDMLDPALLRPGRFDRHIEITLPDIAARKKILELHMKDKPFQNIMVKEWAQKTSGFSGAKLENLINEAAILACKENSISICDSHIDKAFSIILAGYEKQERGYIKDADKKITAYHEIGHVLCGLNLLPNEKISKVTIIPTTKGAGGYTLSIPEDLMYVSKDYLKKKIMILLGGRAAEEIIFGNEKITTGAQNDLKKSTNIAFTMTTQYGMGNTLGLLNLEELMQLNISTENILSECTGMINSLYDETKKLLAGDIKKLVKLSESLISNESLYADDIQKILKEM